MTGATMRAVVMTGTGGPEVLEEREAPLPEPGPGEVRVRVASSGVNRADLLQRQGLYPAPRGYPPDIPGLEFAGEVEALGPRVFGVETGDRVMGLVGGGGYAERVVVHEREVVPVPQGIDLVRAGALPEAYLTAFDAVVAQMDVQAGEVVLIHAVGSGVGTAALQLARWAGARTLGTSRTQEKLERASEMGLHIGLQGGDRDWVADVMEATGGHGADLILDLVGGPYLEGNIRALAPRGRIITVGITGGRKATLDLRGLMAKRGSLTGTVLRARPLEEKAALAQHFRRVALPALAEGRLAPVVDATFPPAEASEAHRRMESNLNFGKLLLVW
ncbi:MAG: NAD(P)H-quinone oxidoreductase [Gemmatimonadota bacterium]